MTTEQKLREALQRIQYKATSLADAQVIALEALALPTTEQAPAQAVPSGWKLVPVEPTKKMLDAVSWSNCAKIDWHHMLDAAPTPPATEQVHKRCQSCGYLTTEREHLGCLRKAVQELDAATGGPYTTEQVVSVTLDLWCETCEGSGKVYEEHQVGIPGAGGERQCPDCDGHGYIRSSRYQLAAQPAPDAGVVGDSHLLDWLERQHLEELSMGVVIDAPHDGEYYVNGDDGVTYYGKTLREALRAASVKEPRS